MSLVADSEPRRPSFFSRLAGDIFNPVLVKEIRQAQRGRVFSISLVVTLLLAMVATLLFALNYDWESAGRAGGTFFLTVYVFLCGAVVLVVPFQAFVSMGSEWEDNTYEMLVLSNLKPRQIIFGKVLAAMTQGLLFVAAFLPFVAVAFLMRGVDVLTLALILGLTVFACLWLSTVTVMLSTLTRKRFLRVLLMVALAGALVALVSAATAIASQWIRRPDNLSDPQFWYMLVEFLLVLVLLGLFAFSAACNLLAHEEENRSSNVRLLMSATIVTMLGLLVFNSTYPATPMTREDVYIGATFLVFLLGAVSVFFACEPERLGRRVAPGVPRSRGMALLTMPWYPGGGRGVVFLLLHLGVLCVGAFVIAALFATSSRFSGGVRSTSLLEQGGRSMLIGVLYVLLYTVVPIGFLHGFATTPAKRNLLRAFALLSPLFYMFVPAVVGIFLGDRDLQEMRHIGNPGLLMDDSWSGGLSHPEFVALLIPLVLAGILMNLPRIARAMGETGRASDARATVQKPDAATGAPSA